MSFANIDCFTSSFPIWIAFISFSCLLLVLELPILCWIKVVRDHLVSDLSGKASSFTSLGMMLAMGMSYMAFIMLGYVPSIPPLLRVFIINEYQILSNASASIKMIIWFLSFILLMGYIILIDLQILSFPCIPEINPTWSWCMILLIHYWIQSANTLRIFTSCLLGILACNFSFFLWHPFLILVSRKCWPSEMILKSSFFCILEEFESDWCDSSINVW